MANYNKSFNFRNGVQVDNDNFVVNANGLVGIGTTVPKSYLLNVYGDTRVTGLVTATSANIGNLNVTGISTVEVLSATNINASGVVTATTFYGSAAGLTGISAVAIDGWNISGGNISTTSNVGIGTTFPTGNFQVGVAVTINSNGNATYIGIVTASSFNGIGSSITQINASNISSGTLNNARLPSNINLSGIVTASSFNGIGSSITQINASNISLGTLSNSRLPSDINVSGVVTASSFNGIGSSITQINASNISSGTLSNSRLPSDINVSGVVTAIGGFVGNVTGTASTSQSLTGSPNISVSNIAASGIITATTLGVSGLTTTTTLVSQTSIGIGTNIPIGDLQIKKTTAASVLVTSDTQSAVISIGRNNSLEDSNGVLRFGNTSSLFPYSDENSLDIINYSTGNLNFYLEAGTPGISTGNFYWHRRKNFARLMALTYDGKLGIAITDPVNTLHVVGTSTVTSDAYFGNNVDVSGNLTINGNLVTSSITANLFGNVTGNLTGDVNSLGISTFSEIIVNGNNSFFGSFVGIGVTDPTNELEVNGIIKATTFVGDGSGLTGVVGTGSGVEIQENGSSVGTAATINFGDNLTVDFSGGVATIDAIGGGLSGISTTNYWESTSAGIHTLSNVGVGTTNPTSALTVKGNTSLETLSVSGITTSSGFNGNLSGTASTVTTSNQNYLRLGSPFNIYSPSDELFSVITDRNLNNKKILIDYAGNMYFGSKVGGSLDTGGFADAAMIITPGNEGGPYSSIQLDGHISAGGTIGGSTIFTNQLSVSGVSTFKGASEFTNNLTMYVTGANSFLGLKDPTFNTTILGMSLANDNDVYLRSATTNLNLQVYSNRFVRIKNGDTFIADFQGGGSCSLFDGGSLKFATTGLGVTVTGVTYTNQLSVSGISTLNSNVSVGGTISVDGGVKLATNNATIVGTSGTAGEIKQIAGAPFYYDGSAWREFVLSSGTPVTVPADTEWDNVVFRATFDDDFTDAKFGATPVYIGAGSSIVGAAVTIGTGSLRLDGVAGAGISYAYRSDYNFTGSWTIEFWMYHDSVDNMPVNGNYAESIVSFGSTSPSGGSPGFFSLAITRDSFANIRFRWYNQNNGSNPIDLSADSGSSYSLTSVDKWRHYALVREGDNGSLHFYIDGVEQTQTINDAVIDNNILNEVGAGLWFGSTPTGLTVQNDTLNATRLDALIDDVRISCGVGTAGQRYNSIGAATTVFTPPTTALPTTGTLSSYVQPPGDKYGEIVLGGSPTWRGTSGVTVSQQSSGNYRVSFASTYINANDYYVLSQGMDQGFASYVGIARSTTHVDLSINKQSDDSAVDTGSLAVQIKNHI